MNDASKTGCVENAFTSKGFSSWHNAREKFRMHELTHCHQSSVDNWENYIKNKPIDALLDEGKALQLEEKERQRLKNREFMGRLIKIARLLVKGGRPFRGHDESEDSLEKGLFLEIVNLLKEFDPFMKEYMESCPKNCKYTSNRIQNDIIEALSNVIIRNISKEVKGRPVSVLADETSDVGHHEQMAVVIRYVPEGEVYPVERFVAMQRLTKCDAESIFNELCSVLKIVGINWQDVAAVCFDGASAMSGEFTGVQARCKELNNLIFFVHCYAHCLNLVLVSACTSSKENRKVFDFFGVIQCIHNFIEGSPKRHAVFEAVVKSMDGKLKTLKSLSTTRWACRSEAVTSVQEQLPAIVSAMEEIIEEITDAKVRATGIGILHQVRSFDFIVCLEIMHPVLQLIVKTSKALQSITIDLVEAMNEVDTLGSALKNLRNDEKEFERIYQKALVKCQLLEIEEPSAKRKRTVPSRIDDCSSTQMSVLSMKEEIKFFTYYPVLDSCCQGLNTRFSQETKEMIKSVGRVMTLTYSEEDGKVLKEKLCPAINTDELQTEIRLLSSKPECEDFPPLTISQWLEWLHKSDRRKIYDSFFQVISQFVVVPVTSCSCERCFSKVDKLKSKLRSTMVQKRLSSLIIPYIEQSKAMSVDIDDVITEFKSMVTFERRMNL